ncbi:MAG: restriction endonuclease subunit S [Planctomycetia bacterium]|nr:restriction endonuclease subunit S [Planctomycetia bacterium]
MKLGDVVNFRNGKGLNTDFYNDKGKYPVWGANGQIARTDQLLNENPVVVVGRVGAYCGSVYAVNEPNWITDNAIIATPKDGVDLNYLYYRLNSLGLIRVAVGSAQPLVTQGGLKVLKTVIPPLPEQKAIARILGSLDDKIELNHQMNRTLEEISQAIFKAWFVDFESFKDSNFVESELGQIPEGWKVGTIGENFDLTMGQSPPGTTYNEEGIGSPFFQGRRDFTNRFPLKRVYCTEPKRFAKKDDSLISVRAPVGDLNMAFEDCCIGRGLAAIRHKLTSRSFTYYSMNYLKKVFNSFEADGTVFGSINKTQFESLKLVIPTNEIIEEFEKTTLPIDEQILYNELEIQALTKTRDTLLPKLISGEVKVS